MRYSPPDGYFCSLDPRFCGIRSPRKIASLMAALRPLGAECFFTNFITGSTGITGWTVVGPEASIVSTNYAALGFTFPAEDGKQWLDLF